MTSIAYCNRKTLLEKWICVIESTVEEKKEYQDSVATRFPTLYPKVVSILTWVPYSNLANAIIALLTNTNRSAIAHDQIIKANGHKLMWDHFMHYKRYGVSPADNFNWSIPLIGLHAYTWTLPDAVRPLFKFSELLPLLCDKFTPSMQYTDLMAVLCLIPEIFNHRHSKFKHPVEQVDWFEKVT
jgi:hypothetical protein